MEVKLFKVIEKSRNKNLRIFLTGACAPYALYGNVRHCSQLGLYLYVGLFCLLLRLAHVGGE